MFRNLPACLLVAASAALLPAATPAQAGPRRSTATASSRAQALAQAKALPPDAPLAVHPDAAANSRREVVVYYANESAPDAREAALIERALAAVAAAHHPISERMLAGAATNLEELPRIVDEDVEALLRHTERAVVFTNRLAREGRALVRRGGRAESVPFAFPRPAAGDVVGTSQPLSFPATLRAALETVLARFPAASHSLTLVVKSHGMPGKPLVAWGFGHLAELSPPELTALLDVAAERMRQREVASHAAGQPGTAREADLGKFFEGEFAQVGVDAPSKEEFMPLLEKDEFIHLLDAEATSPEALRMPAQPVANPGLATGELFTILAESGASFPVVYLESCKSGLTEEQLGALREAPTSIGWLITSGSHGLGFRALEHRQVVRALPRLGTYAAALRAAATESAR